MTTTVRLPHELEARLEHVAAGAGRPKSYYLRSLLEENIERLEWEQALAKKADDIRAGRRPTYSLEEVERELGLED
ncbi:type II toxin-antitoxin system RelB family antitoxin [Zhihengliuella salsuginis]|uniref:RHH-type transcriptional regulator, rel operon repressor / antitoxin RelB n=1 Tax=Zhihengliuella salsuginis TaxID=578222 RepID=A0ABQ3GMB1_9MICC|nr:DUF6290 family protein [Zhihengliuella salsuginis]GHD13809.1 hypothetical protein GCM10008096_30410 [Zhihengliuella salsuginis]